MVASGNYSPTNLTATIHAATGSPLAASGVEDALQLYQDFYGALVQQKLEAQSPYTLPVLIGLSAGIQQGLDLSAQ